MALDSVFSRSRARPNCAVAGLALAERGDAGYGMDWQARGGVLGPGNAWHDTARHDEAGKAEAWQDTARSVKTRQAWHGPARRGLACHGEATQAWHGSVRRGLTCRGETRQARHALARQGRARPGTA